MKNWVNGEEGISMVGLSARFGSSLPTREKEAVKLNAVLANPLNGCSNSSLKVSAFQDVSLAMLNTSVNCLCYSACM